MKNARVINKFDIPVTQGTVDLGQYLPVLEKIAGNLGIKQLQLSHDDDIFKITRVEEFKKKGNAILTTIEIILKPTITLVSAKEEKSKILERYHNNTITGGHIGMNKLVKKLKQIYYWKNTDIEERVEINTKFKITRVEEFKKKGNAVLTTIEIILKPTITVVSAKEEKSKILERYHNNPITGGHIGMNKLVKKLKQMYYWKNMTKDIKKFVKACELCQKNKTLKKTKQPLILTSTPLKAFDTDFAHLP